MGGSHSGEIRVVGTRFEMGESKRRSLGIELSVGAVGTVRPVNVSPHFMRCKWNRSAKKPSKWIVSGWIASVMNIQLKRLNFIALLPQQFCLSVFLSLQSV
ncbi:hypothetical protein AVEN_141950-1 [Araneus ventricosus]|uniref:Uncharacterized protein n=1 Tax=Araneus ventricosus TaxID=182803 RepID=A0A4Y2LZH0_ARAVE|nr:hypothetical protein AVEN_141950-1 [Araneus ventricosus]